MKGFSDLEKCLLFDPASVDWMEDCVREVAFVCQRGESDAKKMIEETIRYDKLCKERNLSIIDYNKGANVPAEFHYIIRAITQELRMGTYRLESLQATLQFIENEAPLHFEGAVLDYGGGGGRDCIAFAKKGLRATLADMPSYLTHPSEGPMVMRRFKGRNLQVEFIPVGLVAFEADRFDYANCTDVLEHCYDVEWALAEVTFALKDGGYFFVFPDFDSITYSGGPGDHLEKNRFYARSGAWQHLMKGLGYSLVAQNPQGALIEFWRLHNKPRTTLEGLLKRAYQATHLWAQRSLTGAFVKYHAAWLNVKSVAHWLKIARSGQDTQHPSIRQFHPRLRALQNLADTIHTLDFTMERLRTLERKT